MTAQVAKDSNALRQRLMRFWTFGVDQRKAHLASFVTTLVDLGRVGLFGGMIRDYARSGARSFSSDIDLVVETTDTVKLQNLLKGFKFSLTKFGGYRVYLDRWHVDVWPVAETWANKAKHMPVEKLEDLTKTTFFNWDAAVFDITTNELHLKPDYLSDIHARLLDINLEANPNPISMVLRTWRLMRRLDTGISARLAEYLLKESLDNSKSLLDKAHSANAYWVTAASIVELQKSIYTHLKDDAEEPYFLPHRQLSFANFSEWQAQDA